MGAFLRTFWNEIGISYPLQFLRSPGCVFKDPCKMHTKKGIQDTPSPGQGDRTRRGDKGYKKTGKGYKERGQGTRDPGQ